MTSQSKSLSQKLERVQNSIQKFPAAAVSLNTATDQLGKSVADLDGVLKKFSLGVPTWVSIVSSKHEEYYYREEIGYAKVGGKWGIAIRTVQGDDHAPEDQDENCWLFPDAPRLLRVRTIEGIPELLEALVESAAEMTKKITEKAEEVAALTAGIAAVITPPKGRMVNVGELMNMGEAMKDVVLSNPQTIRQAGKR